MKDRLYEIFQHQIDFQKRLGAYNTLPIDGSWMANVREQTLACIDELLEALRETPWKPWKQNQKEDIDAFREELIDAQHFLINLMIASGMHADEMYDIFMKKNNKNKKRQDEGY